MPTRILRPGIISSERFNSCDWFAQSLYIRILLLVDDYGRFEWGSPRLLRALAFPLSDGVTMPAVDSACQQLGAVGLIQLYEANGKKYLQITKWQERIRAKASKCPEPPEAADTCQQMPADASNCPPPTPYALRPAPIAQVPAGKPPQEPVASLPVIFPESPEFQKAWADWLQHRKQIKKPVTAKSAEKQFEFLSKLGLAGALESINASIANGWQGLFEPNRKNDNPKHTGRVDRNIGTLNEGGAAKYRGLGKVSSLPDMPGLNP